MMRSATNLSNTATVATAAAATTVAQGQQVAKLVSDGVAAQQAAALAAVAASVATLGGLLGLAPQNLQPSSAAVNAIKLAVVALMGKMSTPPGCNQKRVEYNNPLGRANNAFSRGSFSGLMQNRVFSNFVAAAINFVRCLKGMDGGRPPGAAPT